MAKDYTSDTKYLSLLLQPMQECAKYRPAFGKDAKGSEEGVSIDEFKRIYGADPLYHWVGLDSEMMYAAHKAAGGMTSIYRQLGIGCERLIREVIKDSLSLNEEDVKWSYEYPKEDGNKATHTLDACIDRERLRSDEAKGRLNTWLSECGASLGLLSDRTATLRGVVFEVRQGYKSADSKRQNADLRFGLRASNENYLPVILIVSSQISAPVCRRYRAAQILVLVGTPGTSIQSTFTFFSEIVGYDLVGFFDRNSVRLRQEFTKVLTGLLSPT